MTHEEFMTIYDRSLRHAWATSKDPDKYAQQKKKEKEYNAKYYQEHKEKWDESGSGSYYDEKTGKRTYSFQDERDRQENAAAIARNYFAEKADEERKWKQSEEQLERDRQANLRMINERTRQELRGIERDARARRDRTYALNVNDSRARTASIQSRNAANANKRAERAKKMAGLKAVQSYMKKAEANTTPLTKIKQVAKVAINKGKQLVNKIKSYFS